MEGRGHSAREILADALEIDDPQRRSRYLAQACGGDAALRKEVEDLIQAQVASGRFLPDRPATGWLHEALVSAEEAKSSLDSFFGIPTTEKPGHQIGRYKLLYKLGEGGCGVVYLAEQREPVRRRVALKIIKLGMDTKQVVSRFRAEQQALALMDHPNIAKVFDAGATQNGRPFFVMEFVRGIKITHYCKENRLSTRERIELMIQVCQAIQHAHQKGIIHRDLKPSNILVSGDEDKHVPKVIDFGIAKATSVPLTEETPATGFEQFLGTPGYMSPEQAVVSRLDVDTRSDIYSLGVVLYELLTGTTPFESKEILAGGLDEFRRIVRERQPMRLSTRLRAAAAPQIRATHRRDGRKLPTSARQLNSDLDRIVMKCLEKLPAGRYQSAQELADELGRALRGEPVAAHPIGTTARAWRWCRRKPVIASLGAATALLLLAVAVGSPVAAARIERERQRVQRNVVRQYVAEGNSMVERGDLVGALPWFGKALKEDQDPQHDEIHRLRLGSAIQQCPRLVQVWFHEDTVIDAQFSPDGRWVLTAGEDGVMRVWDAATGGAISPPFQHIGNIRHARFSPDGEYIAAASEKVTGVWEVRTGRALFTSLGKGRPGFCINFSHDGHRIITAGVHSTIDVWDATTGDQVDLHLEPEGDVYWAALSQDGNRIVTRSGERGVTLWDAHTGEQIVPPLSYRAAGHNPELGSDTLRRTCEFSPDSRRLAIPCGDGTARVCDARTGKELIKVSHRGEVRRACFSPDSRCLLTASDDGTARVWDALTGAPVGAPMRHAGPVFDASFSRDARLVVTASWDGTARVWDAATGEPVSAALRHLAAVWRASFSPDGFQVVTASADHTARVWDLLGTGQRRLVVKHPAVVETVTISPDSGQAATVGVDGSARVWDLETGQLSAAFPEKLERIRDIQFSPDGRWVAIARDRVAQILDPGNGSPVAPALEHQGTVNHLSFSADSERLITASSDHFARIWDVPTGKMLFQLEHRESVNFAAFTQGDKYVATVCLSAPVLFHVESGEHWTFNSRERSSITANAGVAQLWSATTGHPLAASWNLGTWVSQVGISRDGLKAIPACSPRTLTENQVFITRLTTGVRLPKPLAHLSGIIYSAFSPNGKLVVTASWDHKARVWDADSGQPVSTWLAHAKAVHCAEFSPDSRLVATASEDGTARVWDAVSGEPVTPPLRHEAAVHSTFFSPNGRRLLTTSVDGEVHVWELPRGTKDEELLQARFLAGQEIDETGSVLPLSLDVFRRSWRGRSAITTAQNANSATSPNTPIESEQDADLESAREAFEKAKELGEARRREARAAEDKVLQSFSPTQEQWVKLIEEWSKAIQAEPEESADFRHRSIVCEHAGRYSDAIDDMREFLWKRGPVPPAQLGIFYLELGEMRLRLGESEKANADFKKVLETPPDESDCLTYYWRALAHEHFGQFQQAIDELSEAIKRPKPSINTLPQFYFDRARNYLHMHEYVKAREDLEMTDRKDPRDRLALAWWYLTAPGVLRSPEKAQSLALEALELSRGDRTELGSWELLARFLALDGEPPQANRTPLNTLGVAYYESGNFAQAIETLEESAKTQSETCNSVQTLFFLAMSYQNSGEPTKARECYAKALKGFSSRQRLPLQEQKELEVLRRRAEVMLSTVRSAKAF